MDWVLFFWAPLVLGTLWGAWQGRRNRFSFSVLLVAPIFSTVLIVGAMMAVGILSRILSGGPPVNPNHTDPLTFVAVLLATAVMYGFGLCLFGAVPALVGGAAGQLGKLWVVHCIRRIGRRGTIQDIQGEPGAAAERPGDPRRD